MRTSEFYRRAVAIERKYRRAMEHLEAKGVVDKLTLVVKPNFRNETVFIQTFFTFQGNDLRQDWEYSLDKGYYLPRVGDLRRVLEEQTKDYLRGTTGHRKVSSGLALPMG